MANQDVPAGFVQARYPWMNIEGKEGYPTRDFQYLILALWNRTGGAQGNPSVSQSAALNFFMFGDDTGSDDVSLTIPGPMGPQGIRGAAGAQGIPGPALVLDVPEPDEPMLATPRTAPGGWFDEKGSGGTYGFASGVDFTGGTSTSLTLSQPYGSQANLMVTFDGSWQGADQFSLSGKTLTFTSAIPVGVSKVYVKGFLMPQ